MTGKGKRYIGLPVVVGLVATVGAALLLAWPPGNAPPVAYPGEDLSVLVGYPVGLDGGDSFDPRGEGLDFDWSFQSRPDGSKAGFTDTSVAEPTFIPDSPGQYVIELKVKDGAGWSLPVTVAVTVMPWFVEGTNQAFGEVTNGAFGGGSGLGAAWGDYDNDGRPDLYVATDGLNRLYRNNGDGAFQEVAAEAGVEGECLSHGAAWGDYDNDADLDLYVVCRHADMATRHPSRPSAPNFLYRNDGDGTFTDVALAAGVADACHGMGASWVDFNMDSWPDLYVDSSGLAARVRDAAASWWVGRGRLFRNNKDGTFTEVTDFIGITGAVGPDTYRSDDGATPRVTQGGLWFDFDNDQDPELLQCGPEGLGPLYRNGLELSGGTFSDVAEAAGLSGAGRCTGVYAGDLDIDGHLDIYVTGLGEDSLWHNNGDGTFTNASGRSGLADAGTGRGAALVDLDGDGLLDVFALSGHAAVVYRNQGDGSFGSVTGLAGLDGGRAWADAAVADYDGDGDMDFYLVNADGPGALFRNETGNNSAIAEAAGILMNPRLGEETGQ